MGLGSNIGDRLNNLKAALKLLKEKVETLRISSVYETEPVGMKDQPWFYNAVVEIKTNLEPSELLKLCKEVEKKLGRGKTAKWGPRKIDIDLLLYNNKTIVAENLAIPHPEIQKRVFVLLPLIEIVPDLVLPDGKKIAQILKEILFSEKVIKTNKRLE